MILKDQACGLPVVCRCLGGGGVEKGEMVVGGMQELFGLLM